MKTTLVLSATLAAMAASATQAQTQRPPCGDRDAIVERLEAKWGETFTGGGMQSASAVFEVWMSEDSGTWTILKTSSNGMACVMATGTNWMVGETEKAIAGVEG